MRDPWKSRPPFGHLFPSAALDPAEKPCEDSTPLQMVDRILQQRREREQTESVSAGGSHYADAAARAEPDLLSAVWPRGEEAELLLQEHRSQVAGLVPFVVVPPAVTSEQLRRTRPFLWKAIMVQACMLDGARQITLGNELLKEICDATMVKSQSTLDLVLGLLVLLTWYR